MLRGNSFGFCLWILLVLCIMICEPKVDSKRKNTKKKIDGNNKNVYPKVEMEHRTILTADDGTEVSRHDDNDKHHHARNTSLQPIKKSNDRTHDGIDVKSKNISYCALSELRKAIRLEMIKNQILRELGLHKPPRITGKHSPLPSIIVDLFDKDNTHSDELNHPVPDMEDEDELLITTEKMVCFEQLNLQVPQDERGGHVMYFNISRSFQIHTADLYFHIKSNIVAGTNIILYRINRHSSPGHLELKQVGKQVVGNQTTQSSWFKFDVRKSLLYWFRHSKDDVGFVIRSLNPHQPNLTIYRNADDDDESTKPFIAVEVKKDNHRRNKRMLGLNCERNSKEKRCCKHPFTVDFDELGWDWILFPMRYEANFCNGECPYAFLQKYSHTHIMQLSNPKGFVGPCCAAKKMSSMSLLYYSDDNMIHKTDIADMIVESCGCF